MAAEKVDRLDVVEANLRKLIKLKPDHAQAYNALGYTLADRTDRLKEAKDYIEKALKLSPDDPFILDSMGWVLFRMGNHKEGLDYLQRAYHAAARSRDRRAPGRGAVGEGQHRAMRRRSGATRSRSIPRTSCCRSTMKRLLLK